MNKTQYIAAYDFGTSGCKLAFVDLEGRVRPGLSTTYPFTAATDGSAEQDPLFYWEAVKTLTPRALHQAGLQKEDITAVVFSTIWKGIIPIDRDGTVLHSNILWLDGRAVREATEMNQALGTTLLSHKDYWPKLLWLSRHRPDILEQTHRILDVNGYLRYRLTGELSTDLTGSYMRSTEPSARAFYDRCAQLCSMDMDLFPPLCRPSDLTGRVTAAAAAETGLPEGAAVYGGCTDLAAIARGAGCALPGDAHVYLGTSGWYGQITPLEKRLHCCLAAAFTEDTDMTFYGMNAACTSVDWAIDRFYPEKRRELGRGIYGWLEQELASVPAGSGGLLATTWLYGERPPVDPNAHALFLNMTFQSTNAHFVCAMREAGAYMLRWKRELTEQISGCRNQVLRAVGGGANSAHWMQILADVMDTPVEVPQNPQYAGTLGAASCVLEGMGIQNTAPAGASRLYLPRPEHRQVYDELYGAYRQLDVLQEVFAKLRKLEGERP